MHQVLHKNTGVIVIESWKWLRGVDKATLLNLLWVPHYNARPSQSW